MALSIKNRLSLWYIGSFLLIFTLFSLTLYTGFKNISIANVDASLINLAKLLNADFYESGTKKFQLDENELKENPLYPLYIEVIHYQPPSKITVLSRAKKATFPEIKKIPDYLNRNPFPHSVYFFKNKSVSYRMLIFPLYKKNHFLLILYSLNKVNRTKNLLLRLLLLIESVILLIVFFWGKFLINKTFLPIRRIVNRANQINAENLSDRIPTLNSPDEIGDLVITLNKMFNRLEASFLGIKQFSDDVAHELKSPITALKGEIEVLLRKERSADEYKHHIFGLLNDTEKLNSMVENMLLISRMESHSLQNTFKSFSLDSLILEICAQKLPKALLKKIKLNIDPPPEIQFKGNAFLIHKMISNLLDNAIKYSPISGTVFVSLKNNSESIIICVKDNGIGIPESALPHLFERFYRVDDSRTRETGGSGLGLAITKAVVNLHNGTIEIKSDPAQGTEVRIFFQK